MIYLLDTNIIIAYLRNNATAMFIEKTYSPLKNDFSPSISAVTLGELKSLALQNNWGEKRLNYLDEILQEVIVIDINSEDILNRYAEIDAFSQCRLEGKLSNFTARNMGKNDLWIAATASVLDATLLTTDNDFDHLQNEFLQVAKIDLLN
jgi:tRNA(fMet)-specific endonuclease VapC